MDIIWPCLKNTNVFCTIPGTALTWLTFSSNSVTATFFFLSGLSLKYIIMAALRTACSNLLSVDNLRTSVSFSGVIPSREWQTGKWSGPKTKTKQKHKQGYVWAHTHTEPFFWIQQRCNSLAAPFLPCLAAWISQLTAMRLLVSASFSSARIK